MFRSILLPTVLLLFYFRTGSALHCYQCIGDASSACENNLNLITDQNCTEGFVCAHYSVQSNSSSTISRGCSDPDVCTSLSAKSTHLIGLNRTVKYCHTCNSTDYCNSALLVQTNNVFLIIPAVVYIIYKCI